MKLLQNTPIELHDGIFVKREDLCGVHGSPTFSKIRGLIEHLIDLKSKGFQYIGYTETSISMAGWGVAWACKMLGLKAVIFDPQYKEPIDVLLFHREQWKKHDAEIISIQSGMAKVNWYISKNLLLQKYPNNSILLPLGLPFSETIHATAIIAKSVLQSGKFNTIISCVGSGTIISGILKACNELKFSGRLIGVMCRSGNVFDKRIKIFNKAGIYEGGVFGSFIQFELIDPGWEYTGKSKSSSPFPCHPYYDLKAWQWLMENIKELKPPVLFWNIGH